MKRKVYIPNLPTRFDAATKSRLPSLDLNPAAAFGELVIVTEGPISSETVPDAIDRIVDAASEMHEEDLIICVGDIIAVSALIAYASDRFGVANLLRWDRSRHAYDVVQVEL